MCPSDQKRTRARGFMRAGRGCNFPTEHLFGCIVIENLIVINIYNLKSLFSEI